MVVGLVFGVGVFSGLLWSDLNQKPTREVEQLDSLYGDLAVMRNKANRYRSLLYNCSTELTGATLRIEDYKSKVKAYTKMADGHGVVMYVGSKPPHMSMGGE